MSTERFPRRYRRWWNRLTYEEQQMALTGYLFAWFVLFFVACLIVWAVAA